MEGIRNMMGIQAFHALLNDNINSPQNIVSTDSRYLEDLTNLSSELIGNLKAEAAKEILRNKYCTADKISPWERISTGCRSIDGVINGGFPINGINEIYGSSGVGKTQLCLQLSIQIQLPNQSKMDNKEVIYISTEDVFPSKRFNQLALSINSKNNLKMNFEDHVFLEHIADSKQLLNCLKNRLPRFLHNKNVGLIVIDSIAGLFRSDNENCNYALRSNEFNNISKALMNLQDEYNLGIVIVNQVTDNIKMGSTEPSLGLSWANNVTCRFRISRTNESPIRNFEVIFTPDLPSKTANFIITPNGIIEVD